MYKSAVVIVRAMKMTATWNKYWMGSAMLFASMFLFVACAKASNPNSKQKPHESSKKQIVRERSLLSTQLELNKRMYGISHTCSFLAKTNIPECYEVLRLNDLRQQRRLRISLANAGCGCNVAFYLVPIRSSTDPTACGDYYCDANAVCGQYCAELDIMEANIHSFVVTAHGAKHDEDGTSVRFGPEFGVRGSCVDSSRPFDLSYSIVFEGSHAGIVSVILEQKDCLVDRQLKVEGQRALDLHAALSSGMTPVYSYWSGNAVREMSWLDGSHCGSQKYNSPTCSEPVLVSIGGGYLKDMVTTFERGEVAAHTRHFAARILILLPSLGIPFLFWLLLKVLRQKISRRTRNGFRCEDLDLRAEACGDTTDGTTPYFHSPIDSDPRPDYVKNKTFSLRL